MTNYQIEKLKVALQAAITAAKEAAGTKLGLVQMANITHYETEMVTFADWLDIAFDIVETFGEEETDELTPEEARIRYYEAQADIAREEADDGE